MHLPARVHTVGDLLAHHHTLGLYCCHCDRWTEAPLERLAREGWARTPIVKLRFRCAVCDGPAQRQLCPPPIVATRGHGLDPAGHSAHSDTAALTTPA